MNRMVFAAGALALAATACGPRIQPLRPVMQNGEILPANEAVVAAARADGEAERAELAVERDAVTAAALASCAPAVCDAIARGELALGMTEAQVFAATRTTPAAWEIRGGPAGTTLTGRSGVRAPDDAVSEIAFVTLRNGRVRSVTYREPQGFRAVAEPVDATLAGRTAAQAASLLRQGDEYTVAGALDRALERYDQADILQPGSPETTLRIARTLDKQLRPVEAIIRYQMFLQQMELERIRARGEAAANFAEAIALAQQRIIVLERQR